MLKLATRRRYGMEYLFDGTVAVEGFDIDYLAYKGPGGMDGFFRDMVTDLSYEIGEQAFAHYLIARDRGKPLTALPIFPSRFFPQLGLSVRRGAGIGSPRDLEGRRVAMSDWAYNPSVWMRGILHEFHGVATEKILWLEDATEPVFRGLDYNRSSRFNVEKIDFPEAERDYFHGLPALLREGRADAVMMAAGGVPDSSHACRLFRDPFGPIETFVRAKGFFPINTLLTLRQDVVDRYPDLGRKLVAAWTEVNARYMEILRKDPNIHDYMGVPLKYLERLGLLPMVDGLDVNRANIDTMIGYCYDQNLISKRPSVEEIFLSSAL